MHGIFVVFNDPQVYKLKDCNDETTVLTLPDGNWERPDMDPAKIE